MPGGILFRSIFEFERKDLKAIFNMEVNGKYL
jgi:hypothetical protein